MGEELPAVHFSQPERVGQSRQGCQQILFSSRICHPRHGTPPPDPLPEFVTQAPATTGGDSWAAQYSPGR